MGIAHRRSLPLGEALALTRLAKTPVIDERILAYADRWDVRPGETMRFKVSTGARAPGYRFDVARIRSAVTHEDGPGRRLVPLPTTADGQYNGRSQTTAIGSYVAFDRHCPVELTGFSVRVNAKPTLVTGRAQSLLGTWDAGRQTGFAIYLDDAGRLSLTVGTGAGAVFTVSTTKPLPLGYWHEATGAYDADNGRMLVSHRCLERGHLLLREAGAERQLDSRPTLEPQDFFIGAWKAPEGSMTAHFNGKLEAPALFASPHWDEASLVAAWDFSLDPCGNEIINTTPSRWNGRAVNRPTRAMKGSRWDGTVHRWTDDPTHYAAIHFHEDDVVDCGWADDIVLSIPPEWESGVYCGRFHQGDDTAYATFFVLPAKGKPGSDSGGGDANRHLCLLRQRRHPRATPALSRAQHESVRDLDQESDVSANASRSSVPRPTTCAAMAAACVMHPVIDLFWRWRQPSRCGTSARIP